MTIKLEEALSIGILLNNSKQLNEGYGGLAKYLMFPLRNTLTNAIKNDEILYKTDKHFEKAGRVAERANIGQNIFKSLKNTLKIPKDGIKNTYNDLSQASKSSVKKALLKDAVEDIGKYGATGLAAEEGINRVQGKRGIISKKILGLKK